MAQETPEQCKKDLYFKKLCGCPYASCAPLDTSFLSKWSHALFGMIFPVVKKRGVEPHTPFDQQLSFVS